MNKYLQGEFNWKMFATCHHRISVGRKTLFSGLETCLSMTPSLDWLIVSLSEIWVLVPGSPGHPAPLCSSAGAGAGAGVTARHTRSPDLTLHWLIISRIMSQKTFCKQCSTIPPLRFPLLTSMIVSTFTILNSFYLGTLSTLYCKRNRWFIIMSAWRKN